MADRISRLKKDEKRLPKVPQTAEGPRRISQGTIGVRKLTPESSRRSSLISESGAANPFRDLVPSGAQVKVLTQTNHSTGRVQHLRRKSKTPIRHLQHVVPILTAAPALKPRKMSMGKVVSHRQHASAAAVRKPMPTMPEAEPEVSAQQEPVAHAILPRKSISIGATQVKLVPNIQPKKSPRIKSSAASEVSGTSYQSGRSSRSHRSSTSRGSRAGRASDVVTLTKDELSQQHLVQPRKLRQSFELRQQGLSAPVVDSAPPRPRAAQSASGSQRPADALSASGMSRTLSSQNGSSQGYTRTTQPVTASAPMVPQQYRQPEVAAPATAKHKSMPLPTRAQGPSFQPARAAPVPPSPEQPPVVPPPAMSPMAWTPASRKPSLAPMPAAPVPAPARAPSALQGAPMTVSTGPRLSLTPPRALPMRITPSPLYSPKGTRMEARIAGYLPRRPSGPISPVRMLRQDSRASLSDGFVQEDDEEAKTHIANSKIEAYLASLNDRKPTVLKLENKTANDVIAQHARQLSFKAEPESQPAPQHKQVWLTDDNDSSAESEPAAVVPQAPRKSSRRLSDSNTMTSTDKSTVLSADPEKDFSLAPVVVPTGMDADEVFRGVKVGWLLSTYNDYVAHVAKRDAKKAAREAKQAQKRAAAAILSPSLNLVSPVASPKLPAAAPTQLKSILKVTEPLSESAAPVAPSGSAMAQVVQERAKAVAADKEAAQAKWRASLARATSSDMIVPYKAIPTPVSRDATPPMGSESLAPALAPAAASVSAPSPAPAPAPAPVQPVDEKTVQRLWSAPAAPVTTQLAEVKKSKQVAVATALAKLEAPARPSISGPRDAQPPLSPLPFTSGPGERVKIFSNEMTFYDPFAKQKHAPSALRKSVRADASPLPSPNLEGGMPANVTELAPSPVLSAESVPAKKMPHSTSQPALKIEAPAAAPSLERTLPTSVSFPVMPVLKSAKSYDLVSGPTSPVHMRKKSSQMSSSSDRSFEEFVNGRPKAATKFENVSSKAQKILGLRNKSPHDVKVKQPVPMKTERSVSRSRSRISVADISAPLELQHEASGASQRNSLIMPAETPIAAPVAMTPEQISLAQFMREDEEKAPRILSPLWQRDSLVERPLVSPFRAPETTRSSQESMPGTGLIQVGYDAARRASSIYSPAQALFNLDQVQTQPAWQDSPEMMQASPMQELFKGYSLSPQPSPQLPAEQPAAPSLMRQMQQKHKFKPVHQLETIAQSPQTNKSSPDFGSLGSSVSALDARSAQQQTHSPRPQRPATPPSQPPAGLGITSPAPISPTHVLRPVQRVPAAKEIRAVSPDMMPAQLAESIARRKQHQASALADLVDRTQTASPFSKPMSRVVSSNPGSREPTPDPFRNLKLPGKASPTMHAYRTVVPQEGLQRKNAPEPLHLESQSAKSSWDSISSGGGIQFRSPFEETAPRSAATTNGAAPRLPSLRQQPQGVQEQRRSPDYVATRSPFAEQQGQAPRVLPTQTDARQRLSPVSMDSAPSMRLAATERPASSQAFDIRSALARSASGDAKQVNDEAGSTQKVVGEVTESLNYYAGTASAAISKWFG